MVWAKKRRVVDRRRVRILSGKLAERYEVRSCGAKEGMKGEGSARPNQMRLKKAGAIVPPTFGALGPVIKETYEELLKSGQVKPVVEPATRQSPEVHRRSDEGRRSHGGSADPYHDQR